MRRIFATACSLILAVLALVGGTSGMVLCLHEMGAIHVESLASAEDAPESVACADDPGDECGPSDAHECDWHMDVALEGINLAELRLEDAEDLLLSPPSITSTIALEEWSLPADDLRGWLQARAPPAMPYRLIVAKTTVLLI